MSAQRPPVQTSAVVVQPNRATAKYVEVVEFLKADRGAETLAIRAMFGGDKELMNRFLAVAFSALANNSKVLKDCTTISIVQAIKDSASLGLEPTGLGGEAAIVPYKDVATLLVMWRGYVKRIRNSRQVTDIDVQLVYSNDTFRLTLGTEPSIYHEPVLQPADVAENKDWRGTVTDAYAWAQMPSGKYIIERMTTAEVNATRDQFARGHSDPDSPWRTSWGEMARKTVLRRLAKRLPGAAVDQLLAVEAKTDQLVDEIKGEVVKANAAIADVREMALLAASGKVVDEPRGNGEASADGTLPEGQAAGAAAQEDPAAAAEGNGDGKAEASPDERLAKFRQQ